MTASATASKLSKTTFFNSLRIPLKSRSTELRRAWRQMFHRQLLINFQPRAAMRRCPVRHQTNKVFLEGQFHELIEKRQKLVTPHIRQEQGEQFTGSRIQSDR